MYILKDETFFDSDRCLPLGLIPPDRNALRRAKIKPQHFESWDLRESPSSPSFSCDLLYSKATEKYTV
jgi:hypothetical protein